MNCFSATNIKPQVKLTFYKGIGSVPLSNCPVSQIEYNKITNILSSPFKSDCWSLLANFLSSSDNILFSSSASVFLEWSFGLQTIFYGWKHTQQTLPFRNNINEICVLNDLSWYNCSTFCNLNWCSHKHVIV